MLVELRWSHQEYSDAPNGKVGPLIDLFRREIFSDFIELRASISKDSKDLLNHLIFVLWG